MNLQAGSKVCKRENTDCKLKFTEIRHYIKLQGSEHRGSVFVPK